MSSRHTITIKGPWTRDEAVAHEALYPGNLVALNSDGEVALQPTEKLDCERAVAVEDDLQGNGIADQYAAADLVQYNVFTPGAHAMVVLKDGENVAIGDALEAANNGEVQKYTNGVKIGTAMEALDLSATGYALASRRLEMRVR